LFVETPRKFITAFNNAVRNLRGVSTNNSIINLFHLGW
jgi:hypothetical protein